MGSIGFDGGGVSKNIVGWRGAWETLYVMFVSVDIELYFRRFKLYFRRFKLYFRRFKPVLKRKAPK